MTWDDSIGNSKCQVAKRHLPPVPNLQPTTDYGLLTTDFSSAFTLIELMVVVAIMGIIMAISIPFAYHTMHKESLTTTVNDVTEVFSNARKQAIMQGQMAEVVFHPKEGRLEVSGASASSSTDARATVGTTGSLPHGSGLSAEIPKDIVVDMLDVNLTEYKDAEMARVRFYPNGTCDECTVILHSDNNQYRKISLELTTGLADVESDYTKFR
jgi:type II secretion system protein H